MACRCTSWLRQGLLCQRAEVCPDVVEILLVADDPGHDDAAIVADGLIGPAERDSDAGLGVSVFGEDGADHGARGGILRAVRLLQRIDGELLFHDAAQGLHIPAQVSLVMCVFHDVLCR